MQYSTIGRTKSHMKLCKALAGRRSECVFKSSGVNARDSITHGFPVIQGASFSETRWKCRRYSFGLARPQSRPDVPSALRRSLALELFGIAILNATFHCGLLLPWTTLSYRRPIILTCVSIDRVCSAKHDLHRHLSHFVAGP